jgi:hypothetical protein
MKQTRKSKRRVKNEINKIGFSSILFKMNPSNRCHDLPVR